MSKPKTITIDDVEYVRADSMTKPAEKVNGFEYVIIRTYSAGVHAGYLARRDGKEVELKQSRRLWYWDGAASLSQLAVDGVSKPENCKFPGVVPSIILTEAIEVIPVSEKSKASIDGVKVWTK